MNIHPSINLDKLRHTVQKYGALSFTTSQAAADYQANSLEKCDALPFEDILRRHAALLGIEPMPSSAAGDTVWKAR